MLTTADSHVQSQRLRGETRRTVLWCGQGNHFFIAGPFQMRDLWLVWRARASAIPLSADCCAFIKKLLT